jgi:hypothetical protein
LAVRKPSKAVNFTYLMFVSPTLLLLDPDKARVITFITLAEANSLAELPSFSFKRHLVIRLQACQGRIMF